MAEYDIIIIGAGAGGLNIASFMNKTGLKVLLIDKTDKNIGGDCLNYGCVPSKALIHISKLVHNAKKSEKFGLNISGKVDIQKVTEYIKNKQEIIRVHENVSYFKKEGMEVVLGEAKFNSKNSIIINKKEYFGKKIIIATGGKPRKLKIEGIEKLKYGKEYFDNESIFDLKKLPEKLVIIGGGPIGIEIGQALNRLGSRVSIIQRGPQFLPKEKRGITDILLKQLEKEGIQFYFDCKPIGIKDNKVIAEHKNNKKYELNFDAVFVSIGRELNIPEGLEKADVELTDDGKIKVNDYLQTTNKRIYLSGDIAGSYQFTHATELHAGVLLHNFFSPFKKKLSYDNFSWVTFTSPEIATFGLNEEQLQERKIKYEKLETDIKGDDRAIVDDIEDGKLIVYVNKGKLLGGSMIAPNAGELFQELVLANSSNLNIKNIFNKIYAYPTASRINKKIIGDYFKKGFSPWKKNLLRRLYR